MKTLKQLREEVKLVESADEGDRKLTNLVRAGLYDAKKIPMLKRALDKDNTKITPTERKALLDLLDNLLSQVLSNKNVYARVRQNLQSKDKETVNEAKENESKRMPFVLVLQRKSVRQFPDGTVALYYAKALDRYVSIPFMDIGISDLTEQKHDEDIIKKLKSVNKTETLHFKNGSITINEAVANKMLSVYEAMNKKNKKKMEQMLNEDINSFNTVMNFATRQ